MGGNVEDRRGLGPAALGGGGVGALVLAAIGYFVFGDPNALSGLQPAAGSGGGQQQGRLGTPTDEEGAFVDAVATSVDEVWAPFFQQAGGRYASPRVVLYDQATGTGCGTGQAAMGPFYCPADQRVYLDLSFFRELGSRFGAPGDFAQAYVIAHEIGHHVQTLTGASERVRRAQQAAGSRAEANQYSVALELQADCYAGVWAHHYGRSGRLEAGDVEEGLRAAAAVGDDTLQRRSSGRVVPDSFTHGSSEQRQQWFSVGYRSGDPNRCDTFGSGRL